MRTLGTSAADRNLNSSPQLCCRLLQIVGLKRRTFGPGNVNVLRRFRQADCVGKDYVFQLLILGDFSLEPEAKSQIS